MFDVLLLRFDAPMMSFGTTTVDNLGPTGLFPGRSMITGLLGNALGYDHSDHTALEQLQGRLRHAVRRDCEGQIRVDYQTVDLGQPFLLDSRAWTTRGRLEGRRGTVANRTGTHIRRRFYVVDSVYTVALTLLPNNQRPCVSDLHDALRKPARPLCLGRKCCLPAGPLLLGQIRASTLRAAVVQADGPRFRSPDDNVKVWWPPEDDPAPALRHYSFTDQRDWLNQIHVGSTSMVEGTIRLGGAA